MTNLQKLREAIIKEIPEIKKIKICCKIKFSDSFGEETIIKVLKDVAVKTDVSEERNLGSCEIIGKPITLADVLRVVKESAYRNVKGVEFRHTKLGDVKTWKNDVESCEDYREWELKEMKKKKLTPKTNDR